MEDFFKGRRGYDFDDFGQQHLGLRSWGANKFLYLGELI